MFKLTRFIYILPSNQPPPTPPPPSTQLSWKFIHYKAPQILYDRC